MFDVCRRPACPPRPGHPCSGAERRFRVEELGVELCNVIDGRCAAVRGELRHRLGVRLQQARFSARPRAARY